MRAVGVRGVVVGEAVGRTEALSWWGAIGSHEAAVNGGEVSGNGSHILLEGER